MKFQDPAQQRLGPIGRHALTLILPDEVSHHAGVGPLFQGVLPSPFASQIRTPYISNRLKIPRVFLAKNESNKSHAFTIISRSVAEGISLNMSGGGTAATKRKDMIRKSLRHHSWFKFPVLLCKFPVSSQKFPVLPSREFRSNRSKRVIST
jgi:hypothetical protein